MHPDATTVLEKSSFGDDQSSSLEDCHLCMLQLNNR